MIIFGNTMIENLEYYTIKIGTNPYNPDLVYKVGQVIKGEGTIYKIFRNHAYANKVGYALIQVYIKRENGAEEVFREYSPFYPMELTPIK